MQWRIARFPDLKIRDEFIRHASRLRIDGVEIERIDGERRVRFRAPAKIERGIAFMVSAHGGKVIPSSSPAARLAAGR